MSQSATTIYRRAIAALTKDHKRGAMCEPCGACPACRAIDSAIRILSNALEESTRSEQVGLNLGRALCRHCRKPLPLEAVGAPEFACPACGLRSIDAGAA